MRALTKGFVGTTYTGSAERGLALKNVALFAAAPFIGLVYAVLLPVIGIALLLRAAARALAEVATVRKAFALLGDFPRFVAAAFIGLVYVLAFPLVGAAMLVWTGAQALTAAPEAVRA